MPALIEVENLSFEYPQPGGSSRRALSHLSFQVQAGEYTAVVGANGSGKTTLARHLNGLLLPTEGSVRIAGMDTRDHARTASIVGVVGMVFQYPEDQIIGSVVEEDVAFGLENLGLPAARMREEVEAALRRVDMWESRQRPAYLLSAGQMQRVALAGVLAMRPRCIVFDEATAMLDPAGREAVLEMMDRLHGAGITILTITHSMSEAARAGRVIALAGGQIALDGPPAQVFRDGPALRGLGLDLPPAALLAEALRAVFPGIPGGTLDLPALTDALPHFPGIPGTGPAAAGGLAPFPDGAEPLIDVVELGHIYLEGTPLAQRALDCANLRVAAGSVHGLLGATGSGKSTLLQHLNGLLLPQEGYVRVGSFSLNNPGLDPRLVRRTAGLVFQIPETQFFEQYVGDEISYGPRMLGTRSSLREDVRQAMEMVGLDFEAYKDRLTFSLSGGERRKVALASILAVQPEILLLDEPTAGLDPASRKELLQALKGYRAGGRTVVVSSHRMEDLAELAEALTVLQAGRDRLSGSTGAVFDQGAALRGWGLEPPLASQLAEALRGRGWPIPAGVYQPEALVAAVGAVVGTAPR